MARAISVQTPEPPCRHALNRLEGTELSRSLGIVGIYGPATVVSYREVAAHFSFGISCPFLHPSHWMRSKYDFEGVD